MKRLIPFLLLLVNGVANADQWLCIKDTYTGLAPIDGDWVEFGRDFEIDEPFVKFILRRPKGDEKETFRDWVDA